MFRRTVQLGRYLGPKWLAYRANYALQQRSGVLRRKMPVQEWDSQPLETFLTDSQQANPHAFWAYRRSEAPPFFFSPGRRAQYSRILCTWDTKAVNPQKLADRLLGGEWRYFEHLWLDIGIPPDWHRNALTGERAPSDRHWSQIPDFGFGDIKVIWEPNRFGFTYALVRAYWRTGDERYAELFWQLVEDWRRHNPPNSGPNWKCGQEITFRVMAWIFGLYGFADASVTTPERVTSLVQMIAISGQRIAANLSYALSQHNNHGISEGVGLWTIGLLFPELKQAGKWRAKGRQVLERLGRDLIYDDGSFVQHSVNYHRLMLHDYLWALRLGQLHNQPFSKELQERVAQAGQFLYQLQDPETGHVPYYGQNDGALILPLNNCDYLDFRPAIQATHYLTVGKRLYGPGPWDEDLLWLFGPEALSSDIDALPRTDLRAEVGGYYTLRSQKGFAFVRCATFQDRPGQADMLHVDLWWRGQNIAIDAGTYSYNAPSPWNNPLAHTAYHNTVTVDDMDQMDRVGKFLWLPWLRSHVLAVERSKSGELAYWEGEHSGYQRLPDPVVHRRGILRIGEDSWLVLDYLKGKNQHKFRLHWLFPDWSYEWRKDIGELLLQTPAGAYYIYVTTFPAFPQWSFIRADESAPRGWRAPYYSYREPALSLALQVHASETFFATLFTPCSASIELNEREIELVTAEWQLTAQLLLKDRGTLLGIARLTGKRHDTLDIS